MAAFITGGSYTQEFHAAASPSLPHFAPEPDRRISWSTISGRVPGIAVRKISGLRHDPDHIFPNFQRISPGGFTFHGIILLLNYLPVYEGAVYDC